LLRYGNIQIAFLIFFLYYGVPIISVQTASSSLSDIVSVDDVENIVDAGTYLKRVLFPISYIGTGIKFARWGMSSAEEAACSFGALGMCRCYTRFSFVVSSVSDISQLPLLLSPLAIMWSSQVTVGQFMDAVESYYLQ
jgi:hypothetical protein